MVTRDDIESFLDRLGSEGASYAELEPNLWLVKPGGALVVQFFGARKPGQPELPAWRELLLGMCKTPLAA